MPLSGKAEPRDIATHWFARQRNAELSPEDLVAFEAWLSEDVQNAEAYKETVRAWDAVGAARLEPRILAMREKARGVASGLRRRLLIAASLAAGIAVTLGAGFAYQNFVVGRWDRDPTVYSTTIGKMSTVALADGSTMRLDTNSIVRVWPGSQRERRLEIVQGRAFFEVHKDPRRPFIVYAGTSSVTAVGTAFDVRMKSDGLSVVLVEGRVKIKPTQEAAPLEMSAGREFVRSAGRWSVSPTDTKVATSWLSGVSVFEEETLDNVVRELNRYSASRIRIADIGIGQRRLSAVIRAGDVDTFARSVESLGLAKVDHGSDGQILLVNPEK